MNKKTLLDTAKGIHTRKIKRFSSTTEDEDLVVAWCNNEIQVNQLMQVKKFQNYTSAYTYIALVCRQIIGRNK